MKRFVYQLEPVLRMREWALRDAQQALADSAQRLAQQERDVDALAERHRAALADWSALAQQGRECGVDAFVRNMRYSADLAVTLQEARVRLESLASERDALAAHVAANSRALDAVEDHRAAMRGRFAQALAVKEFTAADDHWNTTHAGRTSDECNN